MLIAVLSDIHGNLEAFQEVLKKVEDLKVDTLYCLGDTVGYGPFPNECVDLVRKHCKVVLKGNHDSGLVGDTPLDDFNHYGVSAIQWSRGVVTKENYDFLRSLPFTAEPNGLTLVHSSPERPDAWSYILTMRAAQENFAAFKTTLCFIGHTHVPIIIGEDGSINKYKPGARHIINVGSVGQPRDGNPMLAFGIFDSTAWEYELIRSEYDIQGAAEKILNAGLPQELGYRLMYGM